MLMSTACIVAEQPDPDAETTALPESNEPTAAPEATQDALPIQTNADTPLFDVYTAKSIIPAISACLEAEMLFYPGSDVFPVLPVTDESAYVLLYTYAQANYYVEGVGAALSNYEISEFLRLVYGDLYTYEDFENAASKNVFEITALDDAWDFGMGETYAPIVRYTSDEDMPLDVNTPYIYDYEDPFDDEHIGQVAVYVVSDDSTYCVSITKIELLS